MLIEWEDSFKTGINTFDEQHLQLFGMIKKLDIGIKEKKSKEIIGEILDGLFDYTIMHFSAEEKVMIKHGFSGYEEHKKEHDELTRKVKNYLVDYHNNRFLLSADLLGFLSNWLKNHIGLMDKKYAPFFCGKGLE